MSLRYANILGVAISAINQEQAVKQILSWIKHDARQYVSVCTVHTVMECQNSDQMRTAVNQAGMATPDGMPLVWLGTHLSGIQVERVYGPDLMLAVCEETLQTGYSHFFYGGAEGVPELLSRKLAKRFPGLCVAGTCSPPFRQLTDDEDHELIIEINARKPDIIWVGLGTPKQDLWMAKHRARLDAAVLIAVGAAFDFHSGRIAQAPAWMQRSGLEWLFRFVKEPRRLWYRYLILNPLFLIQMVLQLLNIRQSPIE